MFSVAELPELDKGKGNKLIEIPKAKLSAGEERVAGIAVVTEGKGEITLYAGQRKLTLKWADLVEYGGNRASARWRAAARPASCREDRNHGLNVRQASSRPEKEACRITREPGIRLQTIFDTDRSNAGGISATIMDESNERDG